MASEKEPHLKSVNFLKSNLELEFFLITVKVWEFIVFQHKKYSAHWKDYICYKYKKESLGNRILVRV